VFCQTTVIQTKWGSTIFHDTTAKCVDKHVAWIVALMWLVYNSMWHLRQHIACDNIVSQKWNENKTDNKAFLPSIVWQYNKITCSMFSHKFPVKIFFIRQKARLDCPTRLSFYLSKPQIYWTIVWWPTVICRLALWDALAGNHGSFIHQNKCPV